MAEQGFEDEALMARVRSGPLPLPLGVASDSEASVGCRQSRWDTPPPSYEFPKAVKLEIGHSSLSINGLPKAVFVSFGLSSLKRL